MDRRADGIQLTTSHFSRSFYRNESLKKKPEKARHKFELNEQITKKQKPHTHWSKWSQTLIGLKLLAPLPWWVSGEGRGLCEVCASVTVWGWGRNGRQLKGDTNSSVIASILYGTNIIFPAGITCIPGPSIRTTERSQWPTIWMPTAWALPRPFRLSPVKTGRTTFLWGWRGDVVFRERGMKRGEG